MSDDGLRDPAVLSPARVDAENAALNAQLRKLSATLPPTHTLQPAAIRAAGRSGQGPFGPIVFSERAQVRTIPGPGGPVALRIIRPAGTITGVYLHIHGGGWMIGDNDAQDLNLQALADGCALAVVSVAYRLAPEHPYPAGPDDCEAAALWLATNARKEFDTQRLSIGGESAGAHLSAVTLLRMRDRHNAMPFSAANLVFGCYDLGMTPSVRRWGSEYLILSTDCIKWMIDAFVAGASTGNPDISPLHASLQGLPAALFTVGTADPLLDDTLFMYPRWLAAGNYAELAVYPSGAHGFTTFPTAMARIANGRMFDFLRRH